MKYNTIKKNAWKLKEDFKSYYKANTLLNTILAKKKNFASLPQSLVKSLSPSKARP